MHSSASTRLHRMQSTASVECRILYWKEIMKITLKGASKLVAEAAPCKYRGSALAILEKLVRMTYNPKIDDPQRRITNKGIGPLMRAAHVKERQFYKSLAEMSEVLEYERHAGKIDFQLNLAPLAELNPDAERETAAKKSRERKTDWARKSKAAKREQRDSSLSAAIAIARFILSPLESVPTPKADPAYVKSVLNKARAAEGREPWIPQPDYVRVFQGGQLVA